MHWLASIAIAFCFMALAIGEEIAPDIRTKVNELVSQLADAHNEALRTPGTELMLLGEDALPVLREELAKPQLSWWTKAGLARAIEAIEMQSAGEELDPFTRKLYASYRGEMLDRWHASGAHDPRWDADVDECLSALVIEWSFHPKRRGDELERARIACERAIAAGCTDPYISYLDGRLRWLTDSMDDHAIEMIQKGAEGILDSGWHPIDKCFVLWRASMTIQWGWKWRPQGEQARRVEAYMAAFPALLVDAAKDPEAPIESILVLANAYIDFMQEWKGERAEAYEKLHAALDAALPDSPIPPLVCAQFSSDWAWDARGTGWASSVTDEGWRLMRERMSQATAAIKLADRRDPHNVRVPITALELANGSSLSASEVIGLLESSLTLHPGDTEALEDVTDYLEPKWHGTPEKLLDFGRHCLALGDWSNRTPQILLVVHDKLAHYGANGWKDEADPAYWRRDAVWRDVDAVFSGWIQHRPHDIQAHSGYLWHAYAACKFDVARTQDEAVHGHPRFASVGGEQAYQHMHAELSKGKPDPTDF